MITQSDVDNYGSELIGLTRRAAYDAVGPELQRLHAENQNLRASVTRAQQSDIERALDTQVPNWRRPTKTPAFLSGCRCRTPTAATSDRD
jgi:hypothetical protein